MLLAEHRSQSVLSAGDEQERRRQQHDGNEERHVCDGSECKEDVEAGADGAEQQHESPISHAEGIPRVADEPEYEGQIERDGGHQPENGDLVRLQVQLVLEEKADWNIDQASEGRTEGQQDDQDGQVEEYPLPDRL